jgi:DNA-binding transcriptional ArsR family regulator
MVESKTDGHADFQVRDCNSPSNHPVPCFVSAYNDILPIRSINALMARMNRDALEKVAASFRALSEPTRLAIIQELKAGDRMTVNQIVESLGLSQANISKHLAILRDAQFLKREQHGVTAIYSINDPMVIELCTLVCDHLNRQAATAAQNYNI